MVPGCQSVMGTRKANAIPPELPFNLSSTHPEPVFFLMNPLSKDAHQEYGQMIRRIPFVLPLVVIVEFLQ